jgi:hypothetical protein
MDASFISISPLYTGQTNELRFVTVPITATSNNLLLCFVIACDTNLSPVTSPGWNLLHKTENKYGTGTTFVFWNHPTGTTINPTYSVSGLSGPNKLNAGYVIMLSGCTKNISKMFNYDQTVDYDVGHTNGNMVASKPNSLAIRMVGTFSGATFTSWDSSPSITWTTAAVGTKSINGKIIRLGVSYHSNIDTTNYSLSLGVTGTIPANNVHNLALTKRPKNANLMVNSA